MRERWRAGSLSPRTLVMLAGIEAAIVLLALSVFWYTRPLPALAVSTSFVPTVSAPPAEAPLPWPDEGQAALVVVGMGQVSMGTGPAQPQPIASTTKMMTGLLLLEGHVLQPGEDGPAIEITEEHAAGFMEAILNDESAVEVRAGENLTLRQAMEGLLVASANNYARILAEWDAGSVEAFVGQMNARAAELGMSDTRFADPAGLSAENVSTATDLLVLAQVAMANPLFAEIVAQTETTLPVVGTVASTNELLGESGVVGIKTGQTEEAGGCLVFAADIETASGMTRVYGAVVGVEDRETAFAVSAELLEALPGQIALIDVVATGEQVGVVDSAWGSPVALVATSGLSLYAWAGEDFAVSVEAIPLSAPVASDADVGDLIVERDGERAATVDLMVAEDVPKPGIGWRIFRD